MEKKEKYFISKKILIIAAHIGIWAMVIIVPFFFRNEPPPNRQMPDMPPPAFNFYVFNGLLILVFYFNYYVLITNILYEKGLKWYLPLVALTFLIARLIFSLAHNWVTYDREAPMMFFLFPFIFVIAVGLAIRVTSDRLSDERERKERENETLKSELSFLRSQVSPHFIFNIMNNVVAMSRVKPDLVEPTLIQLSQLMRYMLYESDVSKVAIEKEIEYLESFIALQKMRFGDGVEVIFDKKLDFVHSSDGFEYLIEPMLLIPFVENAFKHGIGMISQPFIYINLEVKDNQMRFDVVNKLDKTTDEAKDADSGIGLKNVSRRLELLYGSSHHLKAEIEGEKFIVNLKIYFEK